VFDCHHPAPLARFWAAALDGYEVAAYDEAEKERLRSIGINDPEDDPTVLVKSLGTLPRLWFQAVPEGKTVKNRVHLDLACDDAVAEVSRLEALGATALASQPNESLIVMHDPAGNEFCVLR
jgi:Glyoxalase-like domain